MSALRAGLPVRSHTVIATVALSLCLPLAALANGGNNPKQFASYLNPLQKKGYLNQSQDRVIKKKSFKAGTVSAARPASNSGVGIYVDLPTDKIVAADHASYVESILANDKVNGIAVILPWSLLNPAEDEYKWDLVDELLGACEKHNKTLILRLSTCGLDLPVAGSEPTPDTPKWVLTSGSSTDTETKTNANWVSFSDAAGKQHTMPIFWDTAYLAKWATFVQELASRYDKNPNLHSIGITGGGFTGGTDLLPPFDATAASESKGGKESLVAVLKRDYGLNQRKIIEHWKYVADIFPKNFKVTRLNFAINPPTRNRAGQDALDEISDYLIYRYGERVYLTHQGVEGAKHGFDDYRILLKFRNDTPTGMQLVQAEGGAATDAQTLAKFSKHCLDDGVSFVEVPPSLITSDDAATKTALEYLSQHLGYQLVSQKFSVPDKVSAGKPLTASFSFINIGAAPAIRPDREFDKDVAASYRVQFELRDQSGKPVLLNLHTPTPPTQKWAGGQPIDWQTELKMVDEKKAQLPPGQYTAWLSLIDPNNNNKIEFLNGVGSDKPTPTRELELGKVEIVDGPVAEAKPVQKAEAPGSQQ